MRAYLHALRIFRWPNLVMMAAALLLTRYCIFLPVYNTAGVPVQTTPAEFLLLLAATLLIAAGGYVVNDILDTGLDDLNKPGKNIVGTIISEKSAWTLYYTLSAAGVLAGTLLSWLAGKTELGILFLIVATSLYYYSLKYKYLPLWGNLTVALLTALAIFIGWLFEFFFLKQSPGQFVAMSLNFSFINRFVLGFAFFGFFTTIIRELVKDMQDKEGDARFGCRTLPVILEKKKTRWLLLILVSVLAGLIVLSQIYLFNTFRVMALFLSVPAMLTFYCLILITKVRNATDYGRLSLCLKLIMAAGLASMALLWFPY